MARNRKYNNNATAILRRSAKAQSGLTLVELLMSLFIFALLSALAVVVLRLGVNGQERLHDHETMLSQLELARSLMQQDLAQLAPRTVRERNGRPHSRQVLGGRAAEDLGPDMQSGDQLLLSFVRAGRLNPGSVHHRSELQYVEYIFRPPQIIRRARDYLDATAHTPVTSRVLFDQVSDVQWTFFDGTAWSDTWLSTADKRGPLAYQLTLEHETYGPLRQLLYAGPLSGGDIWP